MKRIFRFAVTTAIFIVTAVFIARLLFPLPDISERPFSQAIPSSPTTMLGAKLHEGAAERAGPSGVLPLQSGHDALSSRLTIIDAAEQSIDAQYYIWHDDTSGILMLDALHRAAKRGVRVRLLLDDNGIPGLDWLMATLNAQENFEIRLFNPSTVRNPKFIGFTFDFFRMNRRMHNKSLVVDGAVAIVGGRNIGDEYFKIGDDSFYEDMDVLAAGGVVSDLASVFDQYWNSQSVFAVETIIDSAGEIETFTARVVEIRAGAGAFLQEVSDTATEFARGAKPLEWTTVLLVADDPVKGLGVATPDQLMSTRLGEILGDIETRIDLASAYFVPGQRGTSWLTGLADAGVDVRVLTNALNTTDVLLVHAGYTKYRRDLLEAGVRLYELKLGADPDEGNRQAAAVDFTRASLHAKILAIDAERVFIGSFNFDPRSIALNCEMGLLIDSPTIARQVSAVFDGSLEKISYQPKLTHEDKMIWTALDAAGETTLYQEEPGATWFQQIAIVVIGLLPVEWLL